MNCKKCQKESDLNYKGYCKECYNAMNRVHQFKYKLTHPEYKSKDRENIDKRNVRMRKYWDRNKDELNIIRRFK